MRIVYPAFTYSASGGMPSNAQNCAQYILTRLLIGSLAIEARGRRLNQLTDYSKITPVKRASFEKGAFKTYARSNGVALGSRAFIQRSLADNRPLYQELLLEFSEFFVQSSLKCHAAAFVFLYRALERVSFSFPLVYCSIERDYARTYKTLKRFFENEEVGELGFLKAFVKQTDFIDRASQDVSYDVSFSKLGRGAGASSLSYVKSLSADWTLVDDGALVLGIKFKHVHDLFVTVRNRFLHARSGDGADNLKLSKIVEADLFFESLNPVFCSYVALLSLETMARKYIRI